MAVGAADISALFEQSDWSTSTFEHFCDLAHASFAARERFESALQAYAGRVDRGDGDTVRLGIGLLILGRFGEALERLARGPSAKVRHFYAAQAAEALGRFDDALDELRAAAGRGWDPLEIDLRTAAILLRKGELDQAKKLVHKYDGVGQERAEWHFVRGLLREKQADRDGAMEAYEKALTLDPDHAQAMFRCAWLYDLQGEDEQAIELYERLALQPRAHVNALINIAVIYEDTGRFDEAGECLQRVLRVFPNHARARLFFKDVESCQVMVIEEFVEKPVEPRARLLETPLSEFELSVRARNCLKKMKINTLGELIRLSEDELLNYKNFGETSLAEIKVLLTKKGLHLGQDLEEVDVAQLAEAIVAKPPVPPGREAILAKPVADLELSVRARRCLQRLNISTLQELIQYAEADLLATRNFGVTSLNEIKSRLTDHGLSLAPKRAE